MNKHTEGIKHLRVVQSELLEALEGFVGRWDRYEPDAEVDIDKARAAIAKARGGNNG